MASKQNLQAWPVKSASHYEFTQEEINALKGCDKESLYRRCLPFSTFLAGTTYYSLRHGYLKRSERFGTVPKVSLAVILGYFIGKLSYQQQCAEKMMALPNSYLGQLLRDRRDGKISSIETKQSTLSMFGATPSDIYSDVGPGSSLNLDTDRPHYDSDAYQSNSSINSPQETSVPSLSPNPYVDREIYDDDRQQDPEMPLIARAKSPVHSPATNKYGDVIH